MKTIHSQTRRDSLSRRLPSTPGVTTNGVAYIAPGISPLGKRLKGQPREALEALATRHEIDELLAGKASKGNLFVPGRAPEGLKERASVGILDAQRKAYDLTRQHVKPRLAPEAGEALGIGLDVAKSTLPKRVGTLPAGRHMSPEVIMRESRNVATLPPGVAEAMGKFRKGEAQTMGPSGFQYGREAKPDVRKSILKGFDRGEM